MVYLTGGRWYGFFITNYRFIDRYGNWFVDCKSYYNEGGKK